MHGVVSVLFFFFNDTATTEIYTLSLHDALPIFDGPLSSAGFAGATFPGGRSRKGGNAPLRALPLPGLVPRVLADHACHPAAPDDLTVLASRLDRRPHLHGFSPSGSLESVRDPAPREVVRRQLDLHPIAREDPDEVHPHLAAHVREHPVTVVQLHSEHRVRQRLHHGPFDLDRVFLRHFRVSTSGSPSVTATVCS